MLFRSARQKNLLRYWLQVRHLPMPSAAQLQLVLDQVVNARRDAEPLVEWPGVQIRRFKQQLYAMAPLPVFDHNAVYHWDLSQPLTLPGAGTLAARSATGAGIDTSRLDRKGLTIRFRRGGERCQPAGRGASQSLKKLFQEYQLETWLRDRVPLIYSSEQLVMVADLWVCEGFQAAAGEPGWLTVWTPP